MITSQWEAVEVLALAGVETAEATLQRMNTDHITEVIEKIEGWCFTKPLPNKIQKRNTKNSHNLLLPVLYFFKMTLVIWLTAAVAVSIEVSAGVTVGLDTILEVGAGTVLLKGEEDPIGQKVITVRHVGGDIHIKDNNDPVPTATLLIAAGPCPKVRVLVDF